MEDVKYPIDPPTLTLEQQKRLYKVGDMVFVRPDSDEYFNDLTSRMLESFGNWVTIKKIGKVSDEYDSNNTSILVEHNPDDLLIYTDTTYNNLDRYYWYYKCLVSKIILKPDYKPKQKIVREDIITNFENFLNESSSNFQVYINNSTNPYKYSAIKDSVLYNFKYDKDGKLSLKYVGKIDIKRYPIYGTLLGGEKYKGLFIRLNTLISDYENSKRTN